MEQISEKAARWGVMLALAIAGAGAKTARKYQSDEHWPGWPAITAQLVVSGFAGVLAGLICAEMGYSLYISSAATGLAGYAGGETIDLLQRVVRARLGGGWDRDGGSDK